jgi:Polyketide cyclase / dehydrase and lipid transport
MVSNPPAQQKFEHSILIDCPPAIVERTLTELKLMHQWLNPVLICEPVGEWSTSVGSQSRFRIQVPIVSLSLNNEVIDRGPGLIVWKFDGFFRGTDRWECHPVEQGTQLINRFSFEIPNPLIRLGFALFAARWTARDMQTQLQRLKTVAEELS